jgi:hypothetical protein
MAEDDLGRDGSIDNTTNISTGWEGERVTRGAIEGGSDREWGFPSLSFYQTSTSLA